MKALLFGLITVGFIGSSDTVLSQTWKAKYLVNSSTTPANGFPAGLSPSPGTGPTMQIRSRPRTTGTYRLAVYPIEGGQIGDMIPIQITILPANYPSIPRYYGYSRIPLAFSSGLNGYLSNSPNIALAGTNGRILIQSFNSSGGIEFYFTTDGENFVRVNKPDNIIQSNTSAAAADVFLIYDQIVELFSISRSGGNFLPVSPNLFTPNGAIQLVSDGSRIYIFELDDSDILKIFDTNFFGTNPTLLYSTAVPGLEQMDIVSAANNGSNTTLFSVGNKENNVSVLIQKNGNSYTKTPNQVASVVYGNGFFLGSSRLGGISKSTDGGINWIPLSSFSDSGAMTYANGYFFSPSLGVSPDGIYWVAFTNFVYQDFFGTLSRVVYSGPGAELLFLGNRVLSTKKVKGFHQISNSSSEPFIGRVGSIFEGPILRVY